MSRFLLLFSSLDWLSLSAAPLLSPPTLSSSLPHLARPCLSWFQVEGEEFESFIFEEALLTRNTAAKWKHISWCVNKSRAHRWTLRSSCTGDHVTSFGREPSKVALRQQRVHESSRGDKGEARSVSACRLQHASPCPEAGEDVTQTDTLCSLWTLLLTLTPLKEPVWGPVKPVHCAFNKI